MWSVSLGEQFAGSAGFADLTGLFHDERDCAFIFCHLFDPGVGHHLLSTFEHLVFAAWFCYGAVKSWLYTVGIENFLFVAILIDVSSF